MEMAISRKQRRGCKPGKRTNCLEREELRRRRKIKKLSEINITCI
jgi:hypothetical protein